MSPEIPDRWVTAAARVSLARRFGLPLDDYSQDWEWEVADPTRFDEFLEAYASGSLDDDERFAVMEMLIQCVEDIDLPSIELTPQWQSVATLLRNHARLHASSVRYWSCLDDRDLEGCFRVSSPMRVVWREIRRASGDGIDEV